MSNYKRFIMKKFLLLLICLPMFLSAQEVKPKLPCSINLSGSISEQSLAGFSLEHGVANKKKDSLGFKTSKIAQFSYAMSKLDSPVAFFPSIDGQGAQIDLGNRTYFNKKAWNGLYLQNTGTIGAVWFKETVLGNSVGGRYAYWSLFNPDLGYKLQLGHFLIDPSIGFIWKWEIKGSARHGVDNKNFDNFNPRFGLKIGYTIN
jgi:hypothetical protein